MLSLALKNGENVYIQLQNGIDPEMTVAALFHNGPIEVKVLKIRSDRRSIQLGLHAPQGLKIVRGERVDARSE